MSESKIISCLVTWGHPEYFDCQEVEQISASSRPEPAPMPSVCRYVV